MKQPENPYKLKILEGTTASVVDSTVAKASQDGLAMIPWAPQNGYAQTGPTRMGYLSHEAHWLGGDRNYDNVLGEGLESRSIGLFYSNGNMAGFSGFDIVHRAGFSYMYATYDLASSAVS